MGDVFAFNAEVVRSDDEWIHTRLSAEIAPDGDLVVNEEEYLGATVCYQGYVCNVTFSPTFDVVELIPYRHRTEERNVWKDLRVQNEFGQSTAKSSPLGKEVEAKASELIRELYNSQRIHLLQHREVLKRTISKYQLRLAAVEHALEKLDE